MNLTESLSAENKVTKTDSILWAWDMVRSVAALFNSGGGVLRIGVEDDGTIIGGQKEADYHADGSKFAAVLFDYLDPVPPFETREADGYLQVNVRDGVTSPSVLRKELEHPHSKKKHDIGTVFMRRMNGRQPSSEPPKNRSDWQTALHLWETNRGVTIQGQIIVQFCLLVNEWDPFNPTQTTYTKWKGNCLADVSTPFGRFKLRDGLKSILAEMHESQPPPPDSIRSQKGAEYKQRIVDRLKLLCNELGLNPV